MFFQNVFVIRSVFHYCKLRHTCTACWSALTNCDPRTSWADPVSPCREDLLRLSNTQSAWERPRCSCQSTDQRSTNHRLPVCQSAPLLPLSVLRYTGHLLFLPLFLQGALQSQSVGVRKDCVTEWRAGSFGGSSWPWLWRVCSSWASS